MPTGIIIVIGPLVIGPLVVMEIPILSKQCALWCGVCYQQLTCFQGWFTVVEKSREEAVGTVVVVVHAPDTTG